MDDYKHLKLNISPKDALALSECLENFAKTCYEQSFRLEKENYAGEVASPYLFSDKKIGITWKWTPKILEGKIINFE